LGFLSKKSFNASLTIASTAVRASGLPNLLWFVLQIEVLEVL
jgi:hypothetical protein